MYLRNGGMKKHVGDLRTPVGVALSNILLQV